MFWFSPRCRAFVRALFVAGGVCLSAAAAAQPAPPLLPIPAPSPVPSAPPAPLTGAERNAIVQALTAAGEATSGDDASLEAAAIRYAGVELGQRIRPSAVDPLWSIEPSQRAVNAEFEAARSEGRLADWLNSLAPPFAAYRDLRAARSRYRLIVEAGGWPQLKAVALNEGQRGPVVKALRARLAAEGYEATPSGRRDRFDAGLKEALADFQRHHALAASGALNAPTLAALNVSAEARLAQIEANLERWRWVPRTLPAQRLEIDIVSAQAIVLNGEAPVLAMKIVVGDARHQTPMLASALDAVVFNPPWYVPTSIASQEILPKASRDPGYLARNGYHWSGGRLIQRPGPNNSLGQVKFDLQSPFGVYLHDTPVRSAFGREKRTLSHGCMRLEKPRELAVLVLGPQGWTVEQLDAGIETGATRRIPLATTLPLYVFYWTARADASGAVDFRPDIYGWDAKLIIALTSRGAGL